jgi:broad specificity phosphatase PhoE
VTRVEYLLAFLAILIILLVYLRMRPRRYYFVRHGQTLLNKAQIKQGEEGGLSEAGKQQAEEVGSALATLPIHLILSSPYVRAKETSAIIKSHLRYARIRYSSLLAERRNPSAVIGKSTRDPEVMRIVDTIDLSYHEDDYRYADEENFLDLKERAKKCLRYLARHQGREICVVTHHAFLKMLLCYMLEGEALSAHDFIKLSFFNPADNGGITVCEYHPWRRRWVTEGYNEIAQKPSAD